MIRSDRIFDILNLANTRNTQPSLNDIFSVSFLVTEKMSLSHSNSTLFKDETTCNKTDKIKLAANFTSQSY